MHICIYNVTLDVTDLKFNISLFKKNKQTKISSTKQRPSFLFYNNEITKAQRNKSCRM